MSNNHESGDSTPSSDVGVHAAQLDRWAFWSASAAVAGMRFAILEDGRGA